MPTFAVHKHPYQFLTVRLCSVVFQYFPETRKHTLPFSITLFFFISFFLKHSHKMRGKMFAQNGKLLSKCSYMYISDWKCAREKRYCCIYTSICVWWYVYVYVIAKGIRIEKNKLNHKQTWHMANEMKWNEKYTFSLMSHCWLQISSIQIVFGNINREIREWMEF